MKLIMLLIGFLFICIGYKNTYIVLAETLDIRELSTVLAPILNLYQNEKVPSLFKEMFEFQKILFMSVNLNASDPNTLTYMQCYITTFNNYVVVLAEAVDSPYYETIVTLLDAQTEIILNKKFNIENAKNYINVIFSIFDLLDLPVGFYEISSKPTVQLNIN